MTIDITIEFLWDWDGEPPALLRDLTACARADEEITIVVNSSSPPLHCRVDSISEDIGSRCHGVARVHLRAKALSPEERSRLQRLAHAERELREWQAIVMDLRDEGTAR